MAEIEGGAPAQKPIHPSGEYESVRPATIVWMIYISAICGCIFAVVLKGLFGISIATGSSIISDTAILLASNSDQIVGFNEGALIAVTIFAGLGAFFTGIVLSSASGPRGKVAFITILFPSVDSWTWRHQLHVSVCIILLAVSHSIVLAEVDPRIFNSPQRDAFLRSRVANSPSYLMSVFILSFVMSAISSLLTLNSQLNMRGGNFTSQVFDFFAGIGFALRARSCRYLWKSHMLFWSVAGFVAGCCIGANSIEDTLQTQSVAVAIIMLAPLWIYGAILILIRWRNTKRDSNPLTAELISERAAEASPAPLATQETQPIPGEYTVFDTRQYFWITYCCFVAGATNAISRQGIFGRPSTHITGLVARMAMGFQYPPLSSARNISSYSTEEYVFAVLAFGCAGLVTGFCLTNTANESNDKRIYPVKMNFPSPGHWRPGHQIILTLIIVVYAMAHVVFESISGGDKNIVRSRGFVDSDQFPTFVRAWLFNLFASGLVNGLLCTGAQITLRAGNMDGHSLDVFLGLADAVCSRSQRYIWRVRAQTLAIVAFFCGCLFGAAVFGSSFGPSALSLPCITLAPLWVMGIVLLARRLQQRLHKQAPMDLRSEYFDPYRHAIAHHHTLLHKK